MAKRKVPDEEWVSRSQRKRDSSALQDMGAALTRLSSSELKRMPLTPELREAVQEWTRIESHEGRRRQMQFIGRLMREQPDVSAVAAALAARTEKNGAQTRVFKRVEAQRDALLAADDPAELCSEYGERADEIRDLALSAKVEREGGRPPHSFRALFRVLLDMEGRGGL